MNGKRRNLQYRIYSQGNSQIEIANLVTRILLSLTD